MLNDKSALFALRQDINKALASVAETYGVEIQAGEARYTADGFSCSFKLDIELTKTADGEDVGRLRFESDAPLFNIDPADYHATFDLHGEEYRLVGFNLRARKNALLIESTSNNKQYSLDPVTYLKIKGMKKLMETAAA